jgi:GAF domain-containing protein
LLLPDQVLQRVKEIGIAPERLDQDRVLESWLGAPIILGDKVWGAMEVLDYTTPRTYDEHSRDLLVALANQTAIALQNVHLFAQTQAALEEAEATDRAYVRRAWQEHLQQGELLERSGFTYDRTRTQQREAWKPTPDLWRPEIERAVQAGSHVVASDDGGGRERSGLAIPITVRGQTIGVLGVEALAGDRQWTEDDLALMEAVSDQLGQTLETARLFADTQRRAERERLIGEITARIRASTDMEDILKTAARELGLALGTSRALVRVGLEDENGGRQGVTQQSGEQKE